MNYIKLSFICLLMACSSAEEDVVPDNSFSNIRIHSNLNNGRALQGYDPVSYFVSNAAVVGNPNIFSTHDDIIYNFSSEANKELFDQNPINYTPQYGGWCATGMALNFVYSDRPSGKYKIDPSRFSIEDGKLYLFYNFPDYDAYPDWERFGNEIKNRATSNWNSLIR